MMLKCEDMQYTKFRAFEAKTPCIQTLVELEKTLEVAALGTDKDEIINYHHIYNNDILITLVHRGKKTIGQVIIDKEISESLINSNMILFIDEGSRGKTIEYMEMLSKQEAGIGGNLTEFITQQMCTNNNIIEFKDENSFNLKKDNIIVRKPTPVEDCYPFTEWETFGANGANLKAYSVNDDYVIIEHTYKHDKKTKYIKLDEVVWDCRKKEIKDLLLTKTEDVLVKIKSGAYVPLEDLIARFYHPSATKLNIEVFDGDDVVRVIDLTHENMAIKTEGEDNIFIPTIFLSNYELVKVRNYKNGIFNYFVKDPMRKDAMVVCVVNKNTNSMQQILIDEEDMESCSDSHYIYREGNSMSGIFSISSLDRTKRETLTSYLMGVETGTINIGFHNGNDHDYRKSNLKTI